MGTGLESGSYQYDIFKAMLRDIQDSKEANPIGTLVLVGDNAYRTAEYRGGSVFRFEETIGLPLKPIIREGVKVYTALGNSDYGSAQQDLMKAYLGQKDDYYSLLWRMERLSFLSWTEID